MNAAVHNPCLTLLERTHKTRDQFMEFIQPEPVTPAWYVTRDQLPCLDDRLSVKVVAWFRGTLVTGSYTKVHGSRPTFVFDRVLLPELVYDVECWQYWDVFHKGMTDIMGAASAAKHISGAGNDGSQDNHQLCTGTC